MQIILYSTKNCPRCEDVKKRFDSMNIEYIVNQDKEEMKLLGIKYVPVVNFNNKLYNYEEILSNIDNIKYNSTLIKENEKINARKLMSDAKFYEAYSRYDDKKERYETWNESVSRVMTMHRNYYKDKITEELSLLLDEVETAYKDKLVLGAQRALQFGGEQLLSHHSRLYNCCSSYCDRPDFFGGFFYLLLSGCGVGFSVQKQHINKLPNISKRTKSAKTYIVPDSIEGWANTIDVLLSSYFVGGGVYPDYEGRKVYFDLSNIRPKGSFISGGFKAPGSEPLRKALDTIELIIEKELKNNSNKLRPIIAYDICMHIADAVISGGVRRSATICLFSKDDSEMINAKTGDWWVTNPQRGRSNNSVALLRSETTFEEFNTIMDSVKQFGEPGFIWMEDLEFLYNPCFTGDMRLFTADGYKTFKSLKDQDVEIMNKDGKISLGKVWCSGEKEVIVLALSNGNTINCTPNHIFMLVDGSECKAENLISKQLKTFNGEEIFVEDIVDKFKSEVYDFSEPLTHWGIVEGCVVHNCVEVGMIPKTIDNRSGFQACNLTEINGAKSIDKETFFYQCKVASIMGTIQAGYTDFKFLKDATKEIIEKEALIGVGITGMMNNPHILFDKEIICEGARIVKHWNKVVAKLIGINQAARTTVIKPSGNSAVILECASGIHGEHSEDYLRNVQFNKDSEVAQLFLKENPDMCEDSVQNRERDIVVAFPITPNKESKFKKDLLGIKQLEYVKMIQQTWIEEGTNIELCSHPKLRHNVSNTITVDDWDEVTKYIYENRNYLCGVSLLSAFGDKAYPQAPFTEVLKYSEIVDKYGEVALFTSALIETALNSFNNDLWMACATALGYGEKLTKDNHTDLLKRDFVRRFNKFATNFISDEECSNCLKDVYNLHKLWKINKQIKNIDWTKELSKKTYVDIDTIGAVACSGGQCEV